MNSVSDPVGARALTVAPPLVVVVYGPPGSGKSTLAAALATRLRLAHFDKDELKGLLRAPRCGRPTSGGASASPG